MVSKPVDEGQDQFIFGEMFTRYDSLTCEIYLLLGEYVPAIILEPVTVQVKSSLSAAANEAPKLSNATAEKRLSMKVLVAFVVSYADMISADSEGQGACQGCQAGELDTTLAQALIRGRSWRNLMLPIG